MKKIYTYISILALTVFAAGCASELNDPDAIREESVVQRENQGESVVTVTLSVPSSPDTKTTLGAKDGSSYPVKWSAGDGAYLSLNGTAAYASTKDSDTQYTASFKPASLSAYNFLYRGTSANQVSFPATQNYVADGFDPAAMPMYASMASRTDNVTFSHLASLLKFSFTGEKKIDAVTLSAADGTKSLSGTFTVGATDGLLNGTLTPATGGASLTYSFEGHQQLSETPFVFYIAIPAGTYEGGITLDVVDNDSGHMTVTVMNSNETKTIAAGKVREFENVTYIPNKEVNLKQIYNDATFLEFVTAVAGGQKTLNARLTQGAATLSLSAATVSAFNSIEDYKGTFDGNGKTISGLDKPMFATLKGVVKNLTLNSTISVTDAGSLSWGIFAKEIIPSAEVDDLPGLQNCTAQGSITWTPSAALAGNSQLGGLVGNNRGGAISSCTNEATVTIADNGVTNGNESSIGGVAGRTQKGGEGLTYQGDISNCTNSGTVICEADFANNIYIGGVLGFQVEKAESMSGCTNSGLVKVTADASTGAALHLGGVAGLAKGTMENCTNASEGIVTSEACNVTTYLCQGGVVGRLSGTATYETLTNAGTLNVAALGGSTARLIGGVVGRCNEGAVLNGVTNSGNINYTSEDENTTYIGGVVASNTTSGVVLENCNSTGGTLTYSGETARGPLHIGGVVGYSTRPVSSCSNAMTLNVSGAFTASSDQIFSTGGVVGKVGSNELISNCLNTGNINHGLILYGSNGYTFVGGIAGQTEGNIEYSSNGGTITITGKNNAHDPFYGGVVGSTNQAISGKYPTASATNYGALVINTTKQTNGYVHVGGVAGRLHTGGTMTATNNGPITVSKLTCTQAYVGGLAGLTNAATSVVNSGSANLAGGTITINSLTANGKNNYCAFIGGIVGQAKGPVTATNAAGIAVNGLVAKNRWSVGGIVGNNAASDAVVFGTNNGNVVISSGSTSNNSFFVGGIVGHGQGNISSSTNNGMVSNAAPVTVEGKYIQIGGIVGYNESTSSISTSANNGNVLNSGTSKGPVYVGGITSESEANISNCSNTGDVSNSGSATTVMSSSKVYNVQVGGIAGQATAITLSSCTNSGTISNTGNSGAIIAVGGITGAATGSTFTACTNSNSVESSGTANSSDTYSRIGGIIGWAKDACNLSASGSSKNVNSGSIKDSSESVETGFAGIVGLVEGTNSDFSNCRNEGSIIISGTHKIIFAGGVAGALVNTSVFDNTYNSGAITASSATMSNNGYLRLGGIIGGWFQAACTPQTITGCTNTGPITLQPDNFNDNSTTKDYYVGGISGGSSNGTGQCGKALINCTNSGDITMGSSGSVNSGKLFHKYCVGGIIGYTDVNPTGSKCIADIRFRSTSGTNRIGGIAGEMVIDDIHDVTYKGTVNSNGTSGTNYTGGLVGNVGAGTKTFTNCTVSGTMHGANNTNTCAGIFFSCNGEGTGPTVNIASCTVGSGSRIQTAASGYAVTINSANQITADNICGTNGSTRACTTGTNDGNSVVVDPATITL